MGWVISFVPLPLYPWKKSLRYQMNRRLGGPQSRSGCFQQAHSFFFLPGIEPRYLGVPACNLCSIPIGLYIQKIPFFSNLNPIIVYPGGFRHFTHSLQASARTVVRTCCDCFFPNYCQRFIPQSSCNWRCYLQSDRVMNKWRIKSTRLHLLILRW